MTTQLVIRLDEQLKNQSSRLANHEGKSLSELVRDLLTQYTKERDISLYIDTLWQRVEQDLEANNKTIDDVERAISSVRGKNA